MKCLACGWKRANVSNLAFCPSCGDDANLDDYVGATYDDLVTCGACNATYLYWQDTEHKFLVCESYPQPVDKPVDNFFGI